MGNGHQHEPTDSDPDRDRGTSGHPANSVIEQPQDLPRHLYRWTNSARAAAAEDMIRHAEVLAAVSCEMPPLGGEDARVVCGRLYGALQNGAIRSPVEREQAARCCVALMRSAYGPLHVGTLTAYGLLATEIRRRGRLGEAAQIAYALHWIVREQHPEEKALFLQALAQVAAIEEQAENWRESEAIHTELLRLALALHDPDKGDGLGGAEGAIACVGLARVRRQQKRLEETLRWTVFAFEAFPAASLDGAAQPALRNAAGIAFFELGRVEEAYDSYLLGIGSLPADSAQSGDTRGAHLHANAGVAARRMMRWDEAMEHTQVAFAIAERVGLTKMMAELESRLAAICFETSRWPESRRFYRDLAELQHATLKNPAAAAVALNNAGSCAVEDGDRFGARADYDAALRIASAAAEAGSTPLLEQLVTRIKANLECCFVPDRSPVHLPLTAFAVMG